jgi:hypothetical protein
MKLEIFGMIGAFAFGVAIAHFRLPLAPLMIAPIVSGPLVYLNSAGYQRLQRSTRSGRRETIIGNAIVYLMVACLLVLLGYALVGGAGFETG